MAIKIIDALASRAKFGMLTVIGRTASNDITSKFKVIALCDCGEVTFKKFGNLTNGSTQSCGCKAEKSSTESLFAAIKKGSKFD
jgi:hypothetical protein